MAFNFFGFKKRSDIQDVEPKQVVKKLEAAIVSEPDLVQEPSAFAESSQGTHQQSPQKPFGKSAEIETISVPTLAETAETIEPAKESEYTEPSETHYFVATREDVIAAYKIFLGRMPESEEVLATWIGVKPQAILVDFLKSPEFMNHAQKSTFILALAKKVLDDRRQVESTAASGASSSTSDIAAAS